jgi:ABC-type nitrate/sulfonate/bicarbonate transport system substrate-binding protein
MSQGIKFKIVWFDDALPNQLVIRSGVQPGAGLKGHSVSAPSGSFMEAQLDQYLIGSGLKTSDVGYVDLTPQAQVAAWKAKRIDAVVTFYPFTAELVSDGGVLAKHLPGFDVTYFRDDFLASHRDVVQNYVCDMYNTGKQFVKDPNSIWKLLEAEANQPLSAIKLNFPQGLAIAPSSEALAQLTGSPSPAAKSISSVSSFLVGQKKIPTAISAAKAQSYIDPSFAAYVKQGKCSA